MSASMYKKVGIASLIMIASVFLSRVIGVFREMVIANFAGTSGSVDAYQVSFVIPEILNHVAATGFLSITFIPIFSNLMTSNRELEGWRVFSNILNTFGIVLIGFTIILSFFADSLIGYTGLKHTANFQEAVRLTRIVIPAQIFFFMGGILMAVQFAKEQFLIPALAPLIYNGGIILGGVLLYPKLGMEGFSWGALCGAIIGNFVIQFFGARSVGLKWFPVIDIKHPEFKRYFLLTLPLIIGMTISFSNEIIPKLFGSFLSEGSIASLNYGFRIMFILVGLFGQAVGTASYPYLSKLAIENKILELNRLLNNILRKISLVIPCSILVILLRKEIVYLLFQRGQFNADSTLMTSNILICLMIGAFAFTAQTIVNRGFYAMQNTLFPTVCVTVILILTLPLYYLGMINFEIYGIALAISVSTIFQVTILYIFWNKRSSNNEAKAVYLFYLKIIFISIPLGALLFGAKYWLLAGFNSLSIVGSLIHLVVLSLLFVASLFSIGYVFKIREIFEISDFVCDRLKGFGRKFAG